MSSIVDFIKSIDIYGESVSFNIGGKATHNTLLGAALTMIIYTLTFSYGFQNLVTLINDEGSRHI